MSHYTDPLRPLYHTENSTRHFFADLLTLAAKSGKREATARCLVGATLALRFPTAEIAPQFASGAIPFVLNDTTFYVVAGAEPGNWASCTQSLQRGRVFLLVPETNLEAVRENAGRLAAGNIAVESIESFVSTSIELAAQGSEMRRVSLLVELCERFNNFAQHLDPDTELIWNAAGIIDEPQLTSTPR
jgi:hypothetical protein